MRTPTRRWSRRLAAAVLLLAGFQGCADTGTDTASDPTDQGSRSPAPSLSESLSPVGHVLRMGDDGAEVALQVGGTAIVFLPASYTWAEPVVEGDAVTISQDISDEGSSSRSWTVTARRAGTASVTLTGSPTCRSETPSCAAPDVVWSAAFAVR